MIEPNGTLTKGAITTRTADFRASLPHGGVLLGLDPGTKTIGTAISDAGWRFAGAGKTIRRGTFTVVIGLPLNMDASEGPRAQAARAMARNLADLGLPILLWDERWTTQAATRALIEQDMSRAKRVERIDSAAAAMILQAAIDALSGAVL